MNELTPPPALAAVRQAEEATQRQNLPRVAPGDTVFYWADRFAAAPEGSQVHLEPIPAILIKRDMDGQSWTLAIFGSAGLTMVRPRRRVRQAATPTVNCFTVRDKKFLAD